MKSASLTIFNGQSLAWAKVPRLSVVEFMNHILQGLAQRARLCALFGPHPEKPKKGIRLLALLSRDLEGRLEVLSCCVDKSFPSLTPDLPQAQAFEREIFEQWGVEPLGHPWLKPLRFQDSLSGGRSSKAPSIGAADR